MPAAVTATATETFPRRRLVAEMVKGKSYEQADSHNRLPSPVAKAIATGFVPLVKSC